MASISSLSGAQSAAQSGLQQFSLQQAQRNAEQAEQIARSLKADAADAQQRARDAEDTAQSIAIQSDRAEIYAGQARLGLAVIKTVGQMQARLSDVVTRVTEKLQSAEPATPTVSPAAPVINTQGQTTGTVINTTA